MAAFSDNQVCSLEYSITKLRERMLRGNTLVMTHDEFLGLFASVEDREILKLAPKIADISTSTSCFFGEFRHKAVADLTGEPLAELRFDLNEAGGSPVPLRPRNQVVINDADPEVVARITSWVTERITIGYQWSKVRAVLYYLNKHCPSKNQVRFFWPTIIAIASSSYNEDIKDLADRMRELKTIRQVPSLPKEVKDAIRETAGTVACATLLAAEPEGKKVQPPVLVDLYRAKAVKVQHLGYLDPA